MSKQQQRLPFDGQFAPILSSKPLGWQGIDAERYFLSPGHVTVKQGLATHQVMLYLGEPRLPVQAGSTTAVDTMLLSKGEHAFAPAEYKLRGAWTMDVDVFFLRFDPVFIHSIIETSEIDTSRIELLSHTFIPDRFIEQIGLILLDEVRTSGFKTRLYAESLVTSLALHLIRHYSTLQAEKLRVPNDTNLKRLREVLDYIHAYYTQDISVRDLADITIMSPSYFAQFFKQTMGVAPHEYMIACRVEHAKQLLKNTDVPLHEVASQCGFADQSHLTRHFRHIVGMTPAAFRKDLHVVKNAVLKVGENGAYG